MDMKVRRQHQSCLVNRKLSRKELLTTTRSPPAAVSQIRPKQHQRSTWPILQGLAGLAKGHMTLVESLKRSIPRTTERWHAAQIPPNKDLDMHLSACAATQTFTTR